MGKNTSLPGRFKEFIVPKDAEIQVAAFNILAFCGFSVSVITAVTNMVFGRSFAVTVADLAGAVGSMALIIYCHKTGYYRRAMIITVFAIFLGLFTLLYFIQGGYHSGIPAFFIFGIVFTAFLLDGVTMIVLILIELAWYIFLCLYSFYHPATLEYEEKYYMSRIVLDMTLVALSLAITMYFQIRVYRKKQQELNSAILEADKANQAKSDFLAKMSHDIRTPLNTMLAMNELIVANTSSAKIREWVNDSNVSGRILLSMIDDMLDLTRIEAGRIGLIEQPWDTMELFDETAKTWRVLAERSGLRFNFGIDTKLPLTLLGDEDVIRKIVNNLLSNSVKYTKEGYVSLDVRWDPEEKMLEIIISDTGIGIAPGYLKTIFSPFERGAQEVYRETSGSGLGLAIVKELVDTANGTVDCRSVLDEGTTFTVRIPQKVGSDSSIKTEEKEGVAEQGTETKEQFIAPDARILVVDDNQFNRKVIEGFLEPALIQIDDVESGYEALEMIDIKDYDLVLMDLRMPKMDGAETLVKIREEYPDFKAPVVVLTADIMNGVEERLIGQGFSDFLSKPVSSSRLYETIAKFIPDKVVSIKTGSEKELTLSRIESFQDRLMPYGIDLMMALEYNAGNMNEFLMRLDLFEKYATETMGKLRDSSPENGYYLQVHSIKSIAKGVGAFLLAQLSEAAEYRKDDDFSEEIKPVILDEYERVCLGVAIIMEEAC